MHTVYVSKAQPIGDQQIESVTLIIDSAWPPEIVRGPDWVEQMTRIFESDAQTIVDALHFLPGGTLDRVLVKLLSEKVSQHIVPWEKRGG